MSGWRLLNAAIPLAMADFKAPLKVQLAAPDL
jgi:hypothetical protein